MSFKKKKGGVSKAASRLDAKDRNFLRTFGQQHPINDFDVSTSKSVHIVEDNSDNEEETNKKQVKRHFDPRDFVDDDEFELPYKKLLSELNEDDHNSEQQNGDKQSKKAKKKKKKDKNSNSNGNNREANDDDNASENEEMMEALRDESMYAKEVFCKDKLDNDENIIKDPFSLHFENDLDDKAIEKCKESISNSDTETFNLPALGSVLLKKSPIQDLKKSVLEPKKQIDQMFIKQRIVERLPEAIDKVLPENEDSKLDDKQWEILSILNNYHDLYNPHLDIMSDDKKNKFVYTLHALNHVLKTRSRVIAHNDKIKQNKFNPDIEHRDQGLTRPKVLILVPFKKNACFIVKTIIGLLMRKEEEYITNKKRFFDEFSDPEEDKSEENKDAETGPKGEEFKELFSGNIDDHFRIGLSVSKKTLKLYTEFYSSDIIIASPLGLKTIIGSEGDKERDIDFLSSIEILIVDNADVLFMQNWDHVQSVFDNLHMQPKKSHDVDFSRVRHWLLNGHAKFYRQTLIFSSIPTPSINSLFNKFSFNYSGKFQVKLNNQVGTICQIGFQLPQVFHRIKCDVPLELPQSRFQFFTEKILPQFRDEMRSHTLIFIPSYFDFVQLRNYFKKNDISMTYLSEYSDKKQIDRARFLFYHGRVHFLLITERFHFYKRYKIRGINHLIFYDLPNYPHYYSSFCNYLPDAKRQQKEENLEQSFSATILYSKFDAQKLSSTVGYQRASHMLNSDKSVHMFMVEET